MTAQLSAETMQAVRNLKFEDVASVYSGRPGCMCGCKGEYRYASVEGFMKYGPGYGNATGQVSPKQIRKILNLIQAAEEVEVIDGGSLNDNGKIISLNYSENRVYVLYTTGQAAQAFPVEVEGESN